MRLAQYRAGHMSDRGRGCLLPKIASKRDAILDFEPNIQHSSICSCKFLRIADRHGRPDYNHPGGFQDARQIERSNVVVVLHPRGQQKLARCTSPEHQSPCLPAVPRRAGQHPPIHDARLGSS
jgi:hypothetical protein